MTQNTVAKRPPLEGVHVLDLTRVLSGPYCTLLLGELGAEAIKVEQPGKGDPSRRRTAASGDKDGDRFLAWDWNRKSITLNLYEPEGLAVFKDLVGWADIVLENFRPGVMERIGIGYEALKRIKPDIILTSISGYGQTGSYANYPAHNTVVVAFAGLMDMNGYAEGPPLKPPGSMGDCVAGTYAALGTVAALFRRKATGEGEHVDISMIDCVVGHFAEQFLHYKLTGESRTRSGNGSSDRSFAQVYQTADGWIYFQADLENQWKRLAKCLGHPELLEDPEYQTEAGRATHKAELNAITNEWLKSLTKDEAFRILAEAGVPAAPVNSIADIFDGSYMQERGMLREVEHPVMGLLPALGPRIHFEDTPPIEPTYPPLLGEHNDAVYGSVLGYDGSKIAGLRERRII